MKVLTANRLTDGIAVWFADNGKWVETFAPSKVALSDADIEALETERAHAQAAQAAQEIVDVALIDVALENGAYAPLRLRERIRAAGPTNRLDLGKQAELNVPFAEVRAA